MKYFIGQVLSGLLVHGWIIGALILGIRWYLIWR